MTLDLHEIPETASSAVLLAKTMASRRTALLPAYVRSFCCAVAN